MKTSPAYMFYASDTMADRRYREMTLDERGLYLSILNECWVNRCIPSEPSKIAKWLSYSLEDINKSLSDNVLSFFTSKNGELISPDLERYRKELLDRRARQSSGGKKGAKKKWSGAKSSQSTEDKLLINPPYDLAITPRVEKSGLEMIRKESLDKTEIDDEFVKEYNRASNGE